MKNDRKLVLSYYRTVGRISAVLHFELFKTKEEYEKLLYQILEDFQKAEGERKKRN